MQHERIQGKPLLQQVGGKLKTWELVFRFHTSYSDPAEELELLQKMAEKQEAVPLTIGLKFHGYWVIEALPVTYRATDAQANPISLEITVKLKEWVGAEARNPQQLKNFKKVSRVDPATFLGA